MSDEFSSNSNVFQQSSTQYRIVHPTNNFIRFEKKDIQQSIPSRFEQQVKKCPNRLAVKARSYKFTYSELNKAANRVAWAILKQRGKGQETISLLLEHGVPMIVALLGVLKAGKIYVPLDPSFPLARTDYMLRDSEATLMLTDNKNMAFARELANDEIQLINTDELDSRLSTEDPNLPIPPEAFAYILYTSGSTGDPKGVIENHLDVLHFTLSITNDTHVSRHDRVALYGSFAFSGSASDMYPALLNGAALILFDIEAEGIETLAKWLLEEETTVCSFSPALFRDMATGLTGAEGFPKLRLIELGGDRIYKRDVELYRKHFHSDCLLHVGIGASEMKYFRRIFIDKDLEIMANSVPVGYPVEGTEVLIVDEDGRAVGPNQVGEMVVRSRYISPGYWGKPELTAERFEADPEGGEERLYHTGDVGLMMPDGCLFHMGRKDFQVKIRGYRIEIGEVEEALLALHSVREAVVVSRENTSGEQRLIAYLVCTRDSTPTVSTLRRSLVEVLPGYMIPSVFVILHALPLTPVGKIDRLALPDPGTVRPELDNPFVAPRNPVEETLAEIWSQVLDLDEIGAHDNFFELGGHSLLATQMISQLRRVFQIEMPMGILFEIPTVASLAEFIEVFRLKDQSPDAVPRNEGTRQERGKL